MRHRLTVCSLKLLPHARAITRTSHAPGAAPSPAKQSLGFTSAVGMEQRPPTPVRPPDPPDIRRFCWFDETVGLPVTIEGAEAARSKGHKVCPIKDAVAGRLAKVHEQLAVTLLPKRSRLVQLGSKVRSRVDEVRSARQVVERETVSDCEAILERLRAAESVKLAGLNQSLHEVDAEVEAIDRLASHVDKQAAGVALIEAFPDLLRSVDRLASRALPIVSDGDDGGSLADFPRETKQRIDALQREVKYEEALSVKDRMLWEVVQGHRNVEEKLREEKALADEYASEMGSWLELTDRLSREVCYTPRPCGTKWCLRALRNPLSFLARYSLAGERPPRGCGRGAQARERLRGADAHAPGRRGRAAAAARAEQGLRPAARGKCRAAAAAKCNARARAAPQHADAQELP